MTGPVSESRIGSIVILALVSGLIGSTFEPQFADLGGAFSPMFFPRIILMILLGLAILNMAVDLLKKDKPKSIEFWPVLIIAFALVSYVLILVPLGYFASSVLMGMVILLVLGLRNPLQMVLIPAAGAGALVALFNHILKMPLPISPLFWWI